MQQIYRASPVGVFEKRIAVLGPPRGLALRLTRAVGCAYPCDLWVGRGCHGEVFGTDPSRFYGRSVQ